MAKAWGQAAERMEDGVPRCGYLYKTSTLLGRVLASCNYRLARVAASRANCAVATGWLLPSSCLSEVTIVAGSAAAVKITAASSSFSIVFDLRSA